jgi:hypothetical protein
VSIGTVFMFVLEEHIPTFREIDVVDLQAGIMDVIEGDKPFKSIHDRVVAGVARDLCLVVPDQPALGRLGYVLGLRDRTP